MGLQHGHMAEKRLIVKVLGLFGTLADAGLALDAGPRYIGGILRVNGTHKMCIRDSGYILTYYRIPVYVTDLFMAVASNKYVFLILINILLLVVGMFMEVGATNLILGPILAPIAAGFGIDPVHFGMLFVYLLALGQATPPFGTTMFVACGISGVSMGRIAKQLLPFIAVEIFCALLFSFVPALSTWIPSMLA